MIDGKILIDCTLDIIERRLDEVSVIRSDSSTATLRLDEVEDIRFKILEPRGMTPRLLEMYSATDEAFTYNKDSVNRAIELIAALEISKLANERE